MAQVDLKQTFLRGEIYQAKPPVITEQALKFGSQQISVRNWNQFSSK